MHDPINYSTNPGRFARGPGIRVEKNKAQWDGTNCCLQVINQRDFNDPQYDKGLLLPNGGEVMELVSNASVGAPLKGSTSHSGWNRRRAPLDNHQLPLGQFAKLHGKDSKDRLVGKLMIGTTTASQLFLYKSSSVTSEIVFPRSGFQIEYSTKVYSETGPMKMNGDHLLVHPDATVHAILTIVKKPVSVTVQGRRVEAGSGEARASWKISRKPHDPMLEWVVVMC